MERKGGQAGWTKETDRKREQTKDEIEGGTGGKQTVGQTYENNMGWTYGWTDTTS